jgi:hypothetical protein
MSQISNYTRAGLFALAVMCTGAPAVRADHIAAQPILAHNNSDRPIWVAAHYVPAGSNHFISDGWFRVGPGECRLLFYNNGVNIYFYARDDKGNAWQGNDYTTTFGGQSLNMFHRDTGLCYDPWTITFGPN